MSLQQALFVFSFLLGSVQAVIVNFTQTGISTTDSLLCPNRIYTFYCQISGDSLLLEPFDSNGTLIHSFAVIPATADLGTKDDTSEFNFTAISSANGVAASAVMYSSMDRLSVKLKCSDVKAADSDSLSTLVKYPLDAPELIDNKCVNDGSIFWVLNWSEVDCAESYILDIPGTDRFLTTETMISLPILGSLVITSEMSDTPPEEKYCGSLYAKGGNESQVCLPACLIPVVPDPTPSPEVPCFITTPNTELSSGINGETGYSITFIDFPTGGSAYYVTSDDQTVNISVENDVGEISIDSNVTITVFFRNGTEYCSRELQVTAPKLKPSVVTVKTTITVTPTCPIHWWCYLGYIFALVSTAGCLGCSVLSGKLLWDHHKFKSLPNQEVSLEVPAPGIHVAAYIVHDPPHGTTNLGYPEQEIKV